MIFSCLGHTSRICEIHRKIKICLYKRYTYILSAIKAFYNQSKVKWFTNSKVWEFKIPFMCERTNIWLHVIFPSHTLKWVLRIFQLSFLQGRFVQKRTFTFKNGIYVDLANILMQGYWIMHMLKKYTTTDKYTALNMLYNSDQTTNFTYFAAKRNLHEISFYRSLINQVVQWGT